MLCFLSFFERLLEDLLDQDLARSRKEGRFLINCFTFIRKVLGGEATEILPTSLLTEC